MKKYIKVIIPLIVLVIFNPFTYADLGVPTIQAIACVELIDGKKLEGIISLGKGGYNYNYHPNAFCFIHKNDNYQLIPINLEFRKFVPNNYGHVRNKSSELFYAKNISKQQYPKKTFKLESIKNEKILKKMIYEEENYVLTKNITLYTKLPTTLFVEYEEDKDNQIIVKIAMTCPPKTDPVFMLVLSWI